MGLLCCGLSVAIALVASRLLPAVISIFYEFWIRLVRRPAKLTGHGKWAVVTGSTDGIGKQMALVLAKQGMSVLLISRDPTRLAETKKEVDAHLCSGAEAAVLAFDFSNPDRTALEEAVKQLDVGVLVNNVGLSYPGAQYYNELTHDFIDKLIDVNLRSTFHMTRLVYKGMMERRRGAIVCVGSGASVLPSEPLYAAYAAVKGGVEAFCRSLQVEAREANVLVQCHTPLLVTSKLSKIKHPSLTVPSAKDYARDAVLTIAQGSVFDCPSKSPYFGHLLMMSLITTLPRQVWEAIRLRMTKQLRLAFLKKQEQKQH